MALNGRRKEASICWVLIKYLDLYIYDLIYIFRRTLRSTYYCDLFYKWENCWLNNLLQIINDRGRIQILLSDSKAYNICLRIRCSLGVLQVTCLLIQCARVIWMGEQKKSVWFLNKVPNSLKEQREGKMGKRQVRFIWFYDWDVICNLMRSGRVVLPHAFWFLDVIPVTLEDKRPCLPLPCPMFPLPFSCKGKSVVPSLGIGMCVSGSMRQVGFMFSGIFFPMEGLYMFLKYQIDAV